MSEKNYTVIEADYLDAEEGIIKGAVVTAVPGENGLLNVIRIGDNPLDAPVAVYAGQLQATA